MGLPKRVVHVEDEVRNGIGGGSGNGGYDVGKSL